MSIENLITDHLETWTTAQAPKKSGGRGRGKTANGQSSYGIKKLRELILELAVRGKLVPQDPNDEPASVLLEKIAKEKIRLVKAGKFKATNISPIQDYDLSTLSIPNQWGATRLGDIANLVYGKNLPTTSLTATGYDVFGANGVIGKYSTFIYENQEVLISCRGAYSGKANMSPPYCYITNNSIVCELTTQTVSKGYLYLALSSINKNAIVTGSAQPQVTIANANPLIILVPTFDEQHRIVAKVDELMALCNLLEQEQTDNSETHQLLVKTLLDTLTHSRDHQGFIETWQQIEQNFDILFTTPESIDELKQTILQLAVMGKLVPQDANDEPASVLLEKIAVEKARLVKEGKIKKLKPLPEIGDDENLFELPNGWLPVRFAEITQEVSTGPFGTMIHKEEYIQNGVPLVNPSHMVDGGIKVDHSISVNEKKAEELSSYKLFAGDIVMARRGEVGRCALVTETEDGWLCGTGSFRVKFHREISRAYILLLFSSSQVREYLQGESVGATMTNLNHTILSKLPLILPPATEQISIVTKVDELMTLCDSLNGNLNDAQATQVQLADAIVGQAVRKKSP